MAAIDDLKTLLSQDISQLDTLADILGREKTCLANSDVRQLEALTKEKNDLLVAVRERAKQKIRTLVQMGYRPESGEPSRFIRSAGFSDLFQQKSVCLPKHMESFLVHFSHDPDG